MKPLQKLEIWFVIGSQHLYGNDTLRQAEANARHVVAALNNEAQFPVQLVLKPLLTTADEITALCREANYAENCLGIITWLHTFSPAKMWIAGLLKLEKPMLQFHTQFNADIPWETMDMDFMNLNQTAHGGREFGFMGARLRKPSTVAVGHWQDKKAWKKIDQWMRVCLGINESRHLKLARFGDNMREVAVTEGDKIEAQIKFGYSVSAYGLGDLVEVMNSVSQADVDALVDVYEASYLLTPAVSKGGAKRASIFDAARIELGMQRFLEVGGFKAFTTNFENLHGVAQLPGLASQRLMAEGYGFGAEGDWKTAALLRTMKVMGQGLPAGTSFMEDYTYQFTGNSQNDLVIGSHMLEVCPSIAQEAKPTLDVQPLGIGGKDDPARLLFSCPAGAAINATLLDMGNRFRLLINEVDVIPQPKHLPKLPVARAVWKCQPALDVAVEGWIAAGGAHHTVFSQAVTTDCLRIFAEEMGIECLVIDANTDLVSFKNEIRWNEIYFGHFRH